MKKIIKNKLYNTETAKRIGTYESSNISDFHWYRETLYRKKNGEFFIYGEGHAASPYRKAASQNEWESGEAIIPMTYDSAREWADAHLDSEIYESVFGEPTGGSEKVRLNVEITATCMSKLKRMQQETGISIGGLCERYIMGK